MSCGLLTNFVAYYIIVSIQWGGLMKNKLIFKILACALAGISVLSFAGCKKDNNETDNNDPPMSEGPEQVGGDNNPSGNQNQQTEDEQGKDDPVIENNPVADAVKIIKAAGDLEAAYVTWEINVDAKWYNVYVKASTDTNYTTKLDEPLVRKYSTYFRADAVGLKAGKYDFKVVPVDATTEGEAEEFASEAKGVTVESHIRVGFAFEDGNASGAYNDDGTLKSNAEVLYITEKTKDTVSMEVTGANANPCVGLQAILTGYGKGKEERPLAVRLVGNITDLAEMEDGDIVISNKTDKNVYAGSGITFEGIGNDATVNGWGVRVKNARNVEIRNLGFMNCDSKEGDNVGMQQGNDHIWVHNCDMFYGDAGGDADQAKGDGALDTKNTSHVTHSFNHFWDSGKCNLQGMKDETTDNRITYHHNWYDHSDSRHPRIRTCTVHIFNNYFDGNSKYGVGATTGASAFVENNYFRSTAQLRPMLSSMQGTDILDSSDGKGTFSKEDGGIIKSFGNKFDVSSNNLKLRTYSASNSVEFDCYEAGSRDEQVPSTVKTKQGGTTYNNFDTASNMYKYEVETPDKARETVQKYAGRIDGGDLKYTFENSKEDSNSDVIPELKQSVTNYKGGLLVIGGIGDVSSSVGGNTGNGDGDSGNTPATPPAIDGAITCSFENGKPSDSSFAVVGGAKNSSLKINAINTTFSSGLKFETGTTVTFTIANDMQLTLYYDGDVGKKADIDGTKYSTSSVGGDKVITLTLKAGQHVIAKGDQINLYYLVLTPVSN